MKAIIYDRYGPADEALQFGEIDRPTIDSDQMWPERWRPSARG